MAKFLVFYKRVNSKGTATSSSERVEASSDSVAMSIVKDKMKGKYPDYTIHIERVTKG